MTDLRLDGGTFTAETAPTATQVSAVIEDVCDAVVGVIGPIPTVCEPLARQCVLYGVARDIDNGFTSGRHRDERPRSLEYAGEHTRLLTELRAAAGRADSNGDGVFDGGPVLIVGTSVWGDVQW